MLRVGSSRPARVAVRLVVDELEDGRVLARADEPDARRGRGNALAHAVDNPFSQGMNGYALRVDTQDILNAGTDSNLTFSLYGCAGSASVTIDSSYQKLFERRGPVRPGWS